MTSQALADLADRYWRFRCDEFPIAALHAGVATDAVMLLREAPTDYERRADCARAMASELAAMDQSALPLQDRSTAALLTRELDVLISTVATRAHLRPSLFPLGPEFMLTYWAGTAAPQSLAEAQLYVDRLAAIPDMMLSVEESLRQGVTEGLAYPRLVLERVIGQLRGQLAIPPEATAFAAPLARMRPRGERWAAIADQGMATIAGPVYGALTRYAELIEAVLLPAARDSLAATADRDGPAHYRHLIALYTTTDIDPDTIHDFGLAEIERISAAMDKVAEQAGAPDLADFRRRLQSDNNQFAESAENLRQEIEVLSKRIDARIPEYFGRIPRTTYGVQSIPEAVSAKMPPAYAQPNPADNSAAGVHWITSHPAKLPRYMHVPLALHEAWPGHLMHLALMQEMEHLPDFQRYGAMSYSACLEGWALYCEALGEELGFYDSPEKTYGRLEMEMWRALRLVLDTGLHVRGWSREQALALFATHMSMPTETLEAEVDRYIALPAQALGYQLGNRCFRDIRARAEAALGDHFRLRDFHDALMAAGPVTLPVLDMVMDSWIAERLNARAA